MLHNILHPTCMCFIILICSSEYSIYYYNNNIIIIHVYFVAWSFAKGAAWGWVCNKSITQRVSVVTPPPLSLPAPFTLPTHNPSSCLDEIQLQFAKGIKRRYKYFPSRVLQKLHLSAVITTWSSQMWQLLRDKIIIFKKDSKSVVFVSQHFMGWNH